MHRLCVAIALVTAALPASWASAQPNLAPNPGFEMGEADLPLGWGQRTPSDAARELAWSADAPHSGQRCVTITNRTDTLSRWRSGHGGDLRLKPGTAARLSAWVRTHELQGRAYLLLYSLDAKGEVLAQPSS
ncbi:hypothetical protein LLH23_22325, partial [bacterium]|nr:hypothetical protein [bacterium]